MTSDYTFGNSSDDFLRNVWRKGKVVPGRDPEVWRKDICGDLIKYDEHANTDSLYGWEVDHIKPEALGGTDDLDNLQPLQWYNNRRKADTYPWRCEAA